VSKLLDAIKIDVRFIRSHTVQPKWFKVLKVVGLLAFALGYARLFGTRKALVFFACFLSLSLVVHMIYRTKSKVYQQSWLDFVVVAEDGKPVAKSIGPYYYLAVAFNALASVLISLCWPWA